MKINKSKALTIVAIVISVGAVTSITNNDTLKKNTEVVNNNVVIPEEYNIDTFQNETLESDEPVKLNSDISDNKKDQTQKIEKEVALTEDDLFLQNKAQQENENDNIVTEDINNRKLEITDKLLYESVDTEWDSEVKKKLEPIFTVMNEFGSKLISSECKTSICALEISSTDMAALDFFNEKFYEKLAWKGRIEMSFSEGKDNKISSTMYLLRDTGISNEPLEMPN